MKYKIIYHMHPADDVIITIEAKDEAEAVAYAKQYRKDAFSIVEMKGAKAIIKEGMIVRYAPEWCSPGERKYLHVVKENRLNPVTNQMTRWLIQTINMEHMTFRPTSVVEDYMIEPTGFDISEVI